jgi:hypothetical protein
MMKIMMFKIMMGHECKREDVWGIRRGGGERKEY